MADEEEDLRHLRKTVFSTISERGDIRLVKSSDSIQHKSKASTNRSSDYSPHYMNKGRRKHNSHDYDDHRGSRQNRSGRESSSEWRKVISKSSNDEPPEKIRSHVQIVRKPKDEKPLLITVRNDIKDSRSRNKPNDHVANEREYDRTRRNRGQGSSHRDHDSKQIKQAARFDNDSTDDDSANDVDSDYTIEMRSQKGSDDDDDENDSVYSMEFKNIGGSDDDADGDNKDDKGKDIGDKASRVFTKDHVVEEEDFENVDIENDDDEGEDDDSPSQSSEAESATEQKRTVTMRKSDKVIIEVEEKEPTDLLEKGEEIVEEDSEKEGLNGNENEEDNKSCIEKTASDGHPNSKVIKGKETENISICDGNDGQAKNKAKIIEDGNMMSGFKDSAKDVEIVNTKGGIRGNIKDQVKGEVKDNSRVATKVDTAHATKASSKDKVANDAGIKEKLSKEKKLREEIKLLEERLGKEQAKKASEKEIKESSKENNQKSFESKRESLKTEKEIGRGFKGGSSKEMLNNEIEISRKDPKGLGDVKPDRLKEISADAKKKDRFDKNDTVTSDSVKDESSTKTIIANGKEQTESKKEDPLNLSKLQKKRQDIKNAVDDEMNVSKKKVEDVFKHTEKSRLTGAKKKDSLNKNGKMENTKKSQKLQKPSRGRGRKSSESSRSTSSESESSSSSSSSDQSESESGSDSESESTKSDSGQSKSDKSYESESDSSSDSSQSSSSDSESSSSDEENFKRRRRRDSESISSKNDGRRKPVSPRKEKGAGYVSPLRTKRSEWGAQRLNEKRYERANEGYSKIPEKGGLNRNLGRSRGSSKDRTTLQRRTRSRSRGRGRGYSPRPARSRDRRDSRNRRGSGDLKGSRDRRGSGDRRGSRERMGSRNRRGSRDRRDSKGYDGTKMRSRNYKRDSNSLQSRRDTLHRQEYDKKDIGYRGRSGDMLKGRRPSKEASRERTRDKAERKEIIERKHGKSDSKALERTIPEKKIKTESNNNRESSPRQEKTGSVKSKHVDNTRRGDSAIGNENTKPKPLLQLDPKIPSVFKDGAKEEEMKTANEKSPDKKVPSKVVSESNVNIKEAKNDLSRTESVPKDKTEKLKSEAKQEPKPLMEIRLSNIKRPTGDTERQRLRRVSVTGSSRQRCNEERRKVTRVSRLDGTDTEINRRKQDNIRTRENGEGYEDEKTVDNRIFLKRLSSGKAVYLGREMAEGIDETRPIDFDAIELKKPRIVERISDEIEDHRNIRRVISESSSDIPQIQISTDGIELQSKRKVFSRLSRTVTKTKNISINLKTTPVREIEDREVASGVKTDEEMELDKRIQSIREKNAEILRRQREIEEDIKFNS